MVAEGAKSGIGVLVPRKRVEGRELDVAVVCCGCVEAFLLRPGYVVVGHIWRVDCTYLIHLFTRERLTSHQTLYNSLMILLVIW